MASVRGPTSFGAFGTPILACQMRELPATLLRLTRFLGREPLLEVSRKQQWVSLVVGVAVAVLFACCWSSSGRCRQQAVLGTGGARFGADGRSPGGSGLAQGRSAGYLAMVVVPKCLALLPLRISSGRRSVRVGGSLGNGRVGRVCRLGGDLEGSTTSSTGAKLWKARTKRSGDET